MKTLTFLSKTFSLVIALALLLNAALFSQDNQVKQKKEFGIEKATNLGEPVNTSNMEFAPTISADGKTLIFESDREGGGFDNVKLFITHKSESVWTNPISLNNVNSTEWDGAPFLTYDQNFLLISSRRSGGEGKVDIWISQRLGTEWTKPINLGAPVNTSGYDGFASLSSDGKTLYFMRNAEYNSKCDQNFNHDLYYSVKQNENWSEPQKLPYPINSDYCERFPVILADGKTLIFSSTRPGGFGGHDLYKSEMQEDSSWCEPVNLGSFINTPKDDALVSIPASGDIMYFASGEGDYTDLYSIPIPVEVQSTTVITVAGTVMDATDKKPLLAEITIIDVATGRDSTLVHSNQTDGKYIVILNKGKTYDVSVSADGYTFLSTQFDLKELEAYQEFTRDILLEPIETGSKIVLNNIYFDVDSDSLLDVSKYELERAIKLMKENPTMIVEIGGHTDSTASEKYNLDLSLRRAKSVVSYFITNGIEIKRLSAKGYGESQPIASNTTEEGREKNRRVEFSILHVDALTNK